MLQIPGSCLEKVKKHHYACSLQVLVSFKAFNFFNLMNRKNMWPCLFTSCDTVGAVCKSQKAINEKMVYIKSMVVAIEIIPGPSSQELAGLHVAYSVKL